MSVFFPRPGGRCLDILNLLELSDCLLTYPVDVCDASSSCQKSLSQISFLPQPSFSMLCAGRRGICNSVMACASIGYV